jgi:uncharacterized membrane protein
MNRGRTIMGILLIVVGVIWALIGAANLIGMPWTTLQAASGLLAFGLIFNMVLFVIPGLVLAGIGRMIEKRKTAREAGAAPQPTVAGLAEQWSQGNMTDEEFFRRRDTALKPERNCPFCAETIKAEAIVCRFCGRDLPKPEAS